MGFIPPEPIQPDREEIVPGDCVMRNGTTAVWNFVDWAYPLITQAPRVALLVTANGIAGIRNIVSEGELRENFRRWEKD